MAHFAIRGLMHEATLHADEDPDRLSYLPAVRVVRRKRARAVALPPRGTRKALHEAVLRELLGERAHSSRGMQRPRGVNRKMSNYKVRSRGAVSRKRTDFASCVRILK